MGVDLRELIPDKAIRVINDLKELHGRTVAIDAYNALYQFLTAIRQPDGTPLMDSAGRVTSHLSGLFYRTINLVEVCIKPIYVFDGKPPELKSREIAQRSLIKDEALVKYKQALERGDLESAHRYAQMSSRLTNEMVDEVKELLSAMGIPWIQAPSEGEAQAAYLTLRNSSWSTASQDYDSLLFGSPRLIRNLTISGKRKLPKKDIYVEVKPEVIELNTLLNVLDISREQLIDIAILLGTDYNPDGVKGVGPKTALKLIKTYGSLDGALKALPEARFPVDPFKIKEFFLNPPVVADYIIEWGEPDKELIKEVLISRHDFSEDRVNAALERLMKAFKECIKSRVRGLDAWVR
ncbi:MAG: flap endonuclease-1 [Sulfolobales archaeon]|nr:flap endonuclease-1 [Sulfolobales archaeon]MDW7969662.1 flap endonuclease-1 [Sulfolobales archaeon]